MIERTRENNPDCFVATVVRMSQTGDGPIVAATHSC
ncbi:MAG: hypothetical protein K0S86_3868 [Geminicoccaceae bacterium]|nr:hypothetical protein [Geminicoccaceae bacterium]